MKAKTYYYFINLDERDGFYADVRDSNDITVFEIHGCEIFEEGFMSDKGDIDNLRCYLLDLGIIKDCDGLIEGN